MQRKTQRGKKKQLVSELTEKFEANGEQTNFKIGTYELLQIANAVRDGMVEKNNNSDSVIVLQVLEEPAS